MDTLLGHAFIKSLLQRALPLDKFASTFDNPNAWTAHREHYLTDDETGEQGYVDILLLHEKQGLAVIIENKIDSDEHSDQLDLYYRVLQRRGWNTSGLFLTRHGQEPSHSKYVPISYGVVCAVINEVLVNQAVADDVRTLMTHYVDMVRRHIVDELDIDAVCQRLYRKHEPALKLVRERVSARQKILSDVAKDLVRHQVGPQNIDDSVTINDSKLIRFVLPEWRDDVLHTEKWSPILNCILEFGIANSPQEIALALTIGPGNDATRHSLFNLARGRQRGAGPFAVDEAVPSKYSRVYSQILLSPQDYEKLNTVMLEQEIRRQWGTFVERDLPHIKDAIQQWIIEKRDT